MITFLCISSGLFLGWSLGANDAANIFGTAVGSKMIRFRKAAIIASVFVILGAVIQGSGTSETLSKLGAVNELGGAFTVALCSALTVAAITYYKLPVSTSQAIVGAIIGWCLFSSNAANYSVLGTIATTWITGPILGGLFGAIIYIAVRWVLRHRKIHIIKLDFYIRTALIIAGAFSAYSLGANNIANVMGVFINSFPSVAISFGQFTLDTERILFLIGGIAIAIGIVTYSHRILDSVGKNIISLTSEAAIAVVFAQAIVLFLFSSKGLSNLLNSIGLPAFPLVPISSTQLVIGAIVGVGLVRGAQEIKVNLLAKIALGWVITPVAACIITFFMLFIMQNVFSLNVAHQIDTTTAAESHQIVKSTIIDIPSSWNYLLAIILSITFAGAGFVLFKIRKQKRQTAKLEARWKEQVQFADFKKAISDIEVKNIQVENDNLASRLEDKRRELVTYALNIGEQRTFLENVYNTIDAARTATDEAERSKLMDNAQNMLKQKMSFTNETESIYLKAEQVQNDFPARLAALYPNLSEQEKRLTILLRIGLSTKEIAPILNISPKSVEISRYRLRKRLNLSKDDNLTLFIKSL